MGMNIGGAMTALKEGKKVARGGWSGTRITHLYLVQGSKFTVSRPPLSPEFAGQEVHYAAHIDAFWKVPQHCIGAGELHARVWSPANEDLLADDWFITE